MSRDRSNESQMKDEIVNEIFKSTIFNWRKNKLIREKSVNTSNQNLLDLNETLSNAEERLTLNNNENTLIQSTSRSFNISKQSIVRSDSKKEDFQPENQVLPNENIKLVFQQSNSIEININPMSRQSSSFDNENARLSEPFINDEFGNYSKHEKAVNSMRNRNPRRISMPFVIDSNSTSERLKSIVKERTSNTSDKMVKKVSFERLICYQTEIERNIFPKFHNKRIIKKIRPFRSLSTETPPTLTANELNDIISQNKSNQLDSHLENLAQVILIEQKKSLESTITEESSISQDLSHDYCDSLDTPSSSMSIGSDSGLVRQITVGKYSQQIEENAKKKSPNKNQKIEKRPKRLKNNPNEIELFYSKDSDTSDTNSTGRLLYNSPVHRIEKKVRKLPDIPIGNLLIYLSWD